MPPSPPVNRNGIIASLIQAGQGIPGIGGHERKVLTKSALETGRVESNFTNPHGGDADSAGWRQERRSLYRNPTNLHDSIRRYYQEALAHYRPGIKSGQLAAEVQRPAAQYRGRYAAVSGEAERLLKGGAGSAPGGPPGGLQSVTTSTTSTRQVPTFDKAGFEKAQRKQVVAQLLASRGQDKNNPLFTSGLLSAKPVDRTQFEGSKTQTSRQTSSNLVSTNVSTEKATGTLADIVERAAGIAKHAKPYKWGGGHQRAGGSLAQSFDCSGAVSRALGINPKVASEFESFGKPGQGKHVTIYAKDDHVIMAINGHFFGTSHANPGGGAGWIPLSALGKGYLSQFKVRHPSGL